MSSSDSTEHEAQDPVHEEAADIVGQIEASERGPEDVGIARGDDVVGPLEVPERPRHTIRPPNASEFASRLKEFLDKKRRFMAEMEMRSRMLDEPLPELEVLSVEEASPQAVPGMGSAGEFASYLDDARGRWGRRRILPEGLEFSSIPAPTGLDRLRSSVLIQQRMLAQMKKVLAFQSDKLALLRESFLLMGRRMDGERPVPDDVEKAQLVHALDNLREMYEMEVLKRQGLENMVERYEGEIRNLRTMVERDFEPAPERPAPCPEEFEGWHVVDELLAAGRYDEAVGGLEAMLEDRPGDAVILNALGVANFHAGEHDRALECLERALDEDPLSDEAWVNRGFVLVTSGDTKGAFESFKNALVINPRCDEAYEGLMDCAIRDARSAEVEAIPETMAS